MTLPRLILLGMAASALLDGWVWQALLLVAWVVVLQAVRPGSEYRSWQ